MGAFPVDNAWVAALLAGLVFGSLGFFVVLRRLAFIGVGISHSAVAGAALGLAAGLSPMTAASLVTVMTAVAIAGTGRDRLGSDTAIGIYLAAAMGLAALILGTDAEHSHELFAYLFGDLLSVDAGELALLAAAATMVAAGLVVLFRRLMLVAFDEELARAYGVAVDRLDLTLLMLLSLAVLVGVKVVGGLLATGMLVVPAATAALWTSDFRRQVLLAVVLATACCMAGLALALRFELSAGGAVVSLAVAAFAVSLAATRARAAS